MSRFLAPRLASLEAYVPGEQPREMQYVKLNTNESPYPPCPAVERAVSTAAVRRLNLYPDPAGSELRRALAARYGLAAENVLLGNGSDEILNFAFTAFASPEKGAACPDISYGFYPVFAALHGLPLLEVPLKEDFTLCPGDYYGLDRLIVFANPNAPTGLSIRPEQVEDILRHHPASVVVVDEAYVDFGAESCAKLVKQYDNLVVCMTFSKSRSMAGARLGFALAQPALIADLETIRCSTNPYNINSLTLAAGAAAIGQDEYYMENCRRVAQTRAYTKEQLDRRGFVTLPSLANFLFTSCPGLDGGELYRALKARGVLVRWWDKPRLRPFVRVTIGTPEQMNVFLAALDGIREER